MKCQVCGFKGRKVLGYDVHVSLVFDEGLCMTCRHWALAIFGLLAKL